VELLCRLFKCTHLYAAYSLDPDSATGAGGEQRIYWGKDFPRAGFWNSLRTTAHGGRLWEDRVAKDDDH
jgi:hypothetical protein